MIVADSIGFAGTHSIAGILGAVPGFDVVHGTQSFEQRGPIGTGSQTPDGFAESMVQAMRAGRRPIAVHTNFLPGAMKPACERRGIRYRLIARDPVKQIESCYAWALKKTLDASPNMLVTSLKTSLNTVQSMNLAPTLPNVTYAFAVQHICSFNLAALRQGAEVLRMEDLLGDEQSFRAAFDVPVEAELEHFSGAPQHLASHRSRPELDIVAEPARAVIRERIRVGVPAPMVSLAEITEALGY